MSTKRPDRERPKREKPKPGDDKPVSLDPLEPDEALKGLLQVPKQGGDRDDNAKRDADVRPDG